MKGGQVPPHAVWFLVFSMAVYASFLAHFLGYWLIKLWQT